MECYISVNAVTSRLSSSSTDGFYRGDKLINLKLIADEALEKCRDKYEKHFHSHVWYRSNITHIQNQNTPVLLDQMNKRIFILEQTVCSYISCTY